MLIYLLMIEVKLLQTRERAKLASGDVLIQRTRAEEFILKEALKWF